MTRSPANTLGHRPALDVLRGVAVLLVIAVHFAGRARPLIPGAGIGVNLFFVLSGFLITRLLLEEHARSGRIDLRAFMRRRVARLLPALVPLLGWVLVAEFVFGVYGDPAGIVRGIVSTLFYVRNWLTVAGSGEPALGIAWSLAVEEQFYLVWPPLVALVAWRFGPLRVRTMASVFLAVAVAQTAVRFAVFDQSITVLKYSTDTNGMIGLMSGCVLAVSLRLDPATGSGRLGWRVAAVVCVGVLVAIVIGVPADSGLLPMGGWAAASLATAGIIGWAIRTLPPTAGAERSMLRWIGRHSYGLYLWHLPIFVAVRHTEAGLGDVTLRVVSVVLTFAVAWVSMRVVEAPAQRRLAPPRAARLLPLDVTDRVDLRADGSAENGEVVVDHVERIRPGV